MTTSEEEVMGMLIGFTVEGDDDDHSAKDNDEATTVTTTRTTQPINRTYITHVCIMPRAHKQEDRVEISPEQLVEATELAEKLTKEQNDKNDNTQKKQHQVLRVVGWYHSHPRISVFPSHVDLASQFTYQQMEPNWIGLIFSVFNMKDSGVHLLAFQAKNIESSTSGEEIFRDVRQSRYERVPIPIHILPPLSDVTETQLNSSVWNNILSLITIIHKEQSMSFEQSHQSYDDNTSKKTLSQLQSLYAYQSSTVNLIQRSCVPLQRAISDLTVSYKRELERLEAEEQLLLSELSK